MSKYGYLEIFQSLGIRDNEIRLYIWTADKEQGEEVQSEDHNNIYTSYLPAGLGGSVGCASDWSSGSCGFGNILSWILIMKYFLQSFSPFR